MINPFVNMKMTVKSMYVLMIMYSIQIPNGNCMQLSKPASSDNRRIKVKQADDHLLASERENMESVFVQISDTRYGKSSVKLLVIEKLGEQDNLKEIEVNTYLTLNKHNEYTSNNNMHVISTDSQKNAVYILAKKHGIHSIETFAALVGNHFFKYEQVIKSSIKVNERAWNRFQQHTHAFVSDSTITRTTSLHITKSKLHQTSGITGLKLLKTKQSGFTNFYSDKYRTLPDMLDRVLCSFIDATWEYEPSTSTDDIDYENTWQIVKNLIIYGFVGNPLNGSYSTSVQDTLYVIGKLVISTVPHINKIQLEISNVHTFLFNFNKFGKINFKSSNGNVYNVYTQEDAPYGLVSATVRRSKRCLGCKAVPANTENYVHVIQDVPANTENYVPVIQDKLNDIKHCKREVNTNEDNITANDSRAWKAERLVIYLCLFLIQFFN